MKAALTLAVGLLLCTLACEGGEPNSHVSGSRHARAKRRASGTCTDEQVAEFYREFDESACEDDRLDSLVDDVIGSVYPGLPFDEDAADELAQILPTFCSDCIGPEDKLLSQCTPDSDDNFTTPEELESNRRVCATNEDYFCLVGQDKLSSLLTLQSAVVCVGEWRTQPDQYDCSSSCKEAFDTLIDEVGCCITAVMNVAIEDQNADIADYYPLCGLEDPGECSPSYAESDEDGGVQMAATTGLIIALVSIAVVAIQIT